MEFAKAHFKKGGGDTGVPRRRVHELVPVTTRQGTAWSLGNGLRLGTVLVTDASGFAAPQVPETESLVVWIYPPGRPAETLASFCVTGREGLNEWYAENVGYRPDDDEYEPDIRNLLAFVSEMMYRQTTDDDR